MSLNRILVIIDPTTREQPAFQRALDSARETGANIYLYACEDTVNGDTQSRTDDLRSMLDDLGAIAANAGVTADCLQEKGEDWAARASVAAARTGTSMIFKNSFDHSAVQRELRPTSDWTLLRRAPCPVLLVKNYHDWKHRRVLAAINPLSTEPAHVKLNNRIVSLARQFAIVYRSDAHFVTAFHDLNHQPDAGRIARDCGARPEHVHLRQGRAADVIRDVAAELDVDLVMVGTVARDGIKGRVVGNTCERLLDQTHSDLLVLT